MFLGCRQHLHCVQQFRVPNFPIRREDAVVPPLLGGDFSGRNNDAIVKTLNGNASGITGGGNLIVTPLFVDFVLAIEKQTATVMLIGKGDYFLGQIGKSVAFEYQ